MLSFELEKKFLEKVEDNLNETNRRIIPNEETLKSLNEKHPNLPEDYIIYLREIGAGSFRENQFLVHDFLFDLKDMGLQDEYEIKSSIKFFGDNYCGDFSGFDLESSDGTVVEFWHETGEINYTKQTFQNYIREQMLLVEDGLEEKEYENLDRKNWWKFW